MHEVLKEWLVTATEYASLMIEAISLIIVVIGTVEAAWKALASLPGLAVATSGARSGSAMLPTL